MKGDNRQVIPYGRFEMPTRWPYSLASVINDAGQPSVHSGSFSGAKKGCSGQGRETSTDPTDPLPSGVAKYLMIRSQLSATSRGEPFSRSRHASAIASGLLGTTSSATRPESLFRPAPGRGWCCLRA